MTFNTNALGILVAVLISTTLIAYAATRERPSQEPTGEIIVDPAPSPAVLDCLWKVENTHYENDYDEMLAEMKCYQSS